MLKIRLIKKIKKNLFVSQTHEKHAVFLGFHHYEGAILQKNHRKMALHGAVFSFFMCNFAFSNKK